MILRICITGLKILDYPNMSICLVMNKYFFLLVMHAPLQQLCNTTCYYIQVLVIIEVSCFTRFEFRLDTFFYSFSKSIDSKKFRSKSRCFVIRCWINTYVRMLSVYIINEAHWAKPFLRDSMCSDREDSMCSDRENVLKYVQSLIAIFIRAWPRSLF
jgi:hypothetical protein